MKFVGSVVGHKSGNYLEHLTGRITDHGPLSAAGKLVGRHFLLKFSGGIVGIFFKGIAHIAIAGKTAVITYIGEGCFSFHHQRLGIEVSCIGQIFAERTMQIILDKMGKIRD